MGHNGATKAMDMQIFVKWPNGNVLTLKVKPEDSIKSVKVQIQTTKGVDPLCQRLFFAGYPLIDGLRLSDYSIEHLCLLDVLTRICSHCNKWVTPAKDLENAMFASYQSNIMYQLLCRTCHDIQINDEVLAAT